ncbi:MAG: glycosyltransferase family 1 protein [Pseudomonadota bacterium]
MRVRIAIEPTPPMSISVYLAEISRRLEARGVRFAREGPADLLWAPGMGMRRVPAPLLAPGPPRVLTVHGMDAFALPLSELQRGLRHLFWLWRVRWLIRWDWLRLEHHRPEVIAVSDYGRREAIAALSLVPERVSAIPHGVDLSAFCARATPDPLAKGALLHVSQYGRKKNVERLVEAYGAARARIGRPLVVVSKGCPPIALPEGVRLIDGLAHDRLPALYAGARAFVFPSLHETFGLPVLEAMAAGLPVLASDTTALPEIAGDAALLVNPRDEAALAEGMVRIAGDAPLRARLIEAGRARAGAYDWARAAEAHLAVFHRALEVA